ncbi:Mn-containing catalase [Bacillus paralicheniformis]|nr:Mn-containing catalase [Bacillus paralicheniformis]
MPSLTSGWMRQESEKSIKENLQAVMGGELKVTEPPAGFPVPVLPEIPNEHSPGLGDMNA